VPGVSINVRAFIQTDTTATAQNYHKTFYTLNTFLPPSCCSTHRNQIATMKMEAEFSSLQPPFWRKRNIVVGTLTRLRVRRYVIRIPERRASRPTPMGFFASIKLPSLKLTSCLCLLSRLRKKGATPPLPLCLRGVNRDKFMLITKCKFQRAAAGKTHIFCSTHSLHYMF